MKNTNTNMYLIEMLQILEPLRDMGGFAESLKAALNFQLPCEDISCKLNKDNIIIKATSELTGTSLVIKADKKANHINHFLVYTNENKRAIR